MKSYGKAVSGRGNAPSPLALVEAWFADRGWTPFSFQRECWEAYLSGASGLVHAATGMGKTYAAWLGPVLEGLAERGAGGGKGAGGLKVLWLTPLRALAADTAKALEQALAELGLDWRLELRTGDTSSSTKARQLKKLPEALVTTPESLAVLLTHANAPAMLAGLRCVVVDEWHELIGSKRGTLTELSLARLRTFSPGLRTWGLSATVGNLDVALAALTGTEPADARVIRGLEPKAIVIDSLLPGDAASLERFPWAGNLGLRLLPEVVDAAGEGTTCLVFTNTKSRSEVWYQALLDACPDWAGVLGLHHGSLDRDEREFIELGLKLGKLRCVVCTSTLDLGVDFSPVDRVLQVGSPKSVARLVQRAGRSGHGPGLASRVTVVPGSSFDLIETAAARDAAAAGRIEPRHPLDKPLDVLVQHIVTAAMGGGFVPGELLAEVRTAYAYRELTDAEWTWALDFVAKGGRSLYAYPEYRRLTLEDGRYTVTDKDIGLRHRMSVGTIVSEMSVSVVMSGGGRLGSIEESFIARLRPGDRFAFAGRALEFVAMRDMTAWVRSSPSHEGLVPRWHGSRMGMSPVLAEAVRAKLDEAGRGTFASPELAAVRPLLELQALWSGLPARDELLVETYQSGEGHHLFVFPFEGRQVHEGLAALLARRLAARRPTTFTMAFNDYGLELLSPSAIPFAEAMADGLLAEASLAEDVMAGLNAMEMARRTFREIARIAGLVFQGYPGRGKTARQLQSTASLFFEVFVKYDPDNLLLRQAFREAALGRHEEERLRGALARLRAARLLVKRLRRPSPLSFPLMVDHLRDRLSTERLADRVRTMQLTLEREADLSLKTGSAGKAGEG